jgi:hypothetical protein
MPGLRTGNLGGSRRKDCGLGKGLVALHHVIPSASEESLDAWPEDRQLGRFQEERLRPVTRQAGLARQGSRDFSLALEMTWECRVTNARVIWPGSYKFST